MNVTYQEFCETLSDDEKRVFDQFLNLRCSQFEEKAQIKVLENHWGKQYPAARILRSKKMTGIQTDKRFPGRKQYLGFLNTEEGKRETDVILDGSKAYKEANAAKQGGQLSSSLIDTFHDIKAMMMEDAANGRAITSLSRYVKRNGVSPFEREKLQTAKADAIKAMSFEPYFREIIQENIDQFESGIRTMLSSQDFIRSLMYSDYYGNYPGDFGYPPHFTKTEMRKELTEIREELFQMRYLVPLSKGDYRFKTNRWFRDRLDEKIEGLKDYSHKRDGFGDRVMEECTDATDQLLAELKVRFPNREIRSLVHNNPLYAEDLKKYQRHLERKEKEQQDVLERIPVLYRDTFPDARKMHRRFVLHIGPTNSGKTHDAIEALKTAKNGIYLAPLRLLAYEQFETLNDAGVKCSMVTGEERILVEGSTVQSSTVELLAGWKTFDVAVIDEAQMIRDPDRGGAWCAAMYGIKAAVIHVCAAPEAEEILKHIIRDCGDEYETVYHTRKTALQYRGNHFRFPEDVRDGDALICFSRKNVHAVASELSEAGTSVCIIYGNLPYDVRHAEAKRFVNGDANVLVATDAIGMGMNLPIRRVVFLETRKFDGTTVRDLNAAEVKQIAGRAGRFGIYPVGEVISWGTKTIGEGLNEVVSPIDKVVINFPDTLRSVPGKLSKTMRIWQTLPNEKMFVKADISEMIERTKWCEKHSSDKDLIMKFVMIPFDSGNVTLRSAWKKLFLARCENRNVEISGYFKRMDISFNSKMEKLEFQYSFLDLLYNYCTRFQEADCEEIMEEKRRISEEIIDLLRNQKYKKRVCKYCGARLPWRYPYTMCQKCHDSLYQPDWYDDEY